MNTVYLSTALRTVRNPNILVNMVSQRIRQLGQGHKPLVPSDERMSYMDIALREIADGKLDFEIDSPHSLEDLKEKKKK
jgi:DNA-directed RNA polymerase subunit omega